MKSILDSSFRYTPSTQTDLKKTFARLRREQKAADAARVKAILGPVTPIAAATPKPRIKAGGGK